MPIVQSHGGARSGAGRKPTTVRRSTIAMDASTDQALAEYGVETSATDAVRWASDYATALDHPQAFELTDQITGRYRGADDVVARVRALYGRNPLTLYPTCGTTPTTKLRLPVGDGMSLWYVHRAPIDRLGPPSAEERDREQGAIQQAVARQFGVTVRVQPPETPVYSLDTLLAEQAVAIGQLPVDAEWLDAPAAGQELL